VIGVLAAHGWTLATGDLAGRAGRVRCRSRLSGRSVHAVGSGSSPQFGTSMTSAGPVSAQGLYLIVSGIEDARDDLGACGAAVGEMSHAGTPGALFQPDGTSGQVSRHALLICARLRGNAPRGSVPCRAGLLDTASRSKSPGAKARRTALPSRPTEVMTMPKCPGAALSLPHGRLSAYRGFNEANACQPQ